MSLADHLSDTARAELEHKLLRSLRMRGAANYEGVSLKIIGDFPTDGLYSYEVTFSGNRRMSVESFSTMEEAQRAAVAAAMLGKHAEAEAETAPVAQVVAQAARTHDAVHPADRRHWDIGRVVDDYKARGMTAHEAWNRYVIETGLQPQFDLKDLIKVWGGGTARRRKR